MSSQQQTQPPQHPLTGLKLHSFTQILDQLPPLDMMKVQKLLKKQKERRGASTAASATESSPPPRLLISHDFKGNYRPSDFSTVSYSCPSSKTSAVAEQPTATTLLCAPDECFTMELGWKACDVFNYFSHTRISIPPPEWVATCRSMNNNKNNNKKKLIIGTIITEWDEGFKECNDYLLNSNAVDDRKLNQIILRLAALCVEHDFDGYLVNIENPIRDTTKMKKFVQLLDDTVVGMLGKERGLVIWYDSVISPSGQLRWQNTLNKHNSTFFESCGGIFTNYQWSENHAVDALEVVADLNEKKNKNTTNDALLLNHFSSSSVYFGTDCFGRGTFLGGEHNSHKAVGVAMSLGLSAALFAPGWTMENFNHKELGMKMVPSWNSLSSWKASRLSYLVTSSKFWKDILQQVDENCGSYDQERKNQLCHWNFLDNNNNNSNSSSFCASAGCVFSVFGMNTTSNSLSEENEEVNWCQLSALEQQPNYTVPILPSIITYNNTQSSLPSIVLLEHFTNQDARKYGCFWGNRSLNLNFKKDTSSSSDHEIELCSLSSSSGDNKNNTSTAVIVIVELVVLKSDIQYLKSKNLNLVANKKFKFSVIDESFSEEAQKFFLGDQFSVISCRLEEVGLNSSISLSVTNATAKSEADDDVPPPPALSSSVFASLNIGLLRISAASSSTTSKLLSMASASELFKDVKSSSLLSVSTRKRTTEETEKGGASEVTQISSTPQLADVIENNKNEVERITILRRGRRGDLQFCGNIFVCGVWLKCEVNKQEQADDDSVRNNNFSLVLRMKDGSIQYCAL